MMNNNSFRGIITRGAVSYTHLDVYKRQDYDTTQAKFSHEEILDKFRRGQADVLLGTQMVTKGHDFPRVATVGVLSADNSLALDDYRAGERTFEMCIRDSSSAAPYIHVL